MPGRGGYNFYDVSIRVPLSLSRGSLLSSSPGQRDSRVFLEAMVRPRALLGAVLLACNVNAAPDYTDVCQDIASQLSEASEVIYPS